MPVDADSLDVRLLRFRSRRDEPAHVLALSLLEAGRPVEALEVTQAGLTEAEDDTRLLVLEGRAWYEQGDLVQAQAALLRAARLRPNEKEPYRWLGQLMMKRGEPARAVQVLGRALKLDPNDNSLRTALARAERLAKIALDSVQAPEPDLGFDAVAQAGEGRDGLPSAAASAFKAGAGAAEPASSPRSSKSPWAPGSAKEPARAPSLPRVAPLLHADTEVAQPPMWDDARARGGDSEDEGETLPPKLATAAALQADRFPAPARPSRDDLELEPPSSNARATPLAPPPADEDEATVSFELTPELASMLEAKGSFDASPRAEHDPEPAQKPQPLLAPPLVAPVAAPDLRPAEVALSRAERPAAVERDEEEEQGDEEDERTVVRPSFELIEPAPAPQRAEVLGDAVPSSVHVDYEALAAPSPESSGSPNAVVETEKLPALTDVVIEPDPPEKVLETLQAQGIIEGRVEPGVWADKREAEPSGQSTRRSLTVAWVAALLLAGGGAYGYKIYREQRHAEARALIAKAVRAAREGDFIELEQAERDLSEARRLDAKESAAVEELLFVHTARAIESLEGDAAYLRGTLARAANATTSQGLVAAAKAVLAYYERNTALAQSLAAEAVVKGADDARVSYVVGRLDQRMGRLDAEPLLAKAVSQDPELALAWLAQGELMRQTAREEEARASFEKALGSDRHMLRAELWLIILDAAREPAPALITRLDALAARLSSASAAERFLAAVARAGLLIATGASDQAGEVVRNASSTTVADPEAMSMLADRAASVGEHDIAYRYANAAMARAPENRRYRDALANVLLKRGDGTALLAALGDEADQSPWMLAMRARAALLSGSREALDEAKRLLASYRQTDEGRADYDSASLLLRVDLHLGANAESLLAAARSLVESAPDNPLAQTALGETYLEAGQVPAAIEALDKARRLGSEDADAYALLGRAYRIVGDGEQAERALKQALALSPSHASARQSYGAFLLDRGQFAEAENLYASLEKDHASVDSTLGIVDALLGRGEVTAAKERLNSLTPAQRATPAGLWASARVAIADHHAEAAVSLLAPLVAEDSETRTAESLTLYGDALYAASQVDTAAGAYDAALELDPGHPDALVGRAMAALRAEKIPQAVELLDAADKALATRLRPVGVRANALLTRAKLLILQSRFADARKLLNEVVKLPAPAEAHFWYAETLAKEKIPGAAEQYTRYLELEPTGELADRAKKALEPRQ